MFWVEVVYGLLVGESLFLRTLQVSAHLILECKAEQLVQALILKSEGALLEVLICIRLNGNQRVKLTEEDL